MNHVGFKKFETKRGTYILIYIILYFTYYIFDVRVITFYFVFVNRLYLLKSKGIERLSLGEYSSIKFFHIGINNKYITIFPLYSPSRLPLPPGTDCSFLKKTIYIYEKKCVNILLICRLRSSLRRNAKSAVSMFV